MTDSENQMPKPARLICGIGGLILLALGVAAILSVQGRWVVGVPAAALILVGSGMLAAAASNHLPIWLQGVLEGLLQVFTR